MQGKEDEGREAVELEDQGRPHHEARLRPEQEGDRNPRRPSPAVAGHPTLNYYLFSNITLAATATQGV